MQRHLTCRALSRDCVLLDDPVASCCTAPAVDTMAPAGMQYMRSAFVCIGLILDHAQAADTRRVIAVNFGA